MNKLPLLAAAILLAGTLLSACTGREDAQTSTTQAPSYVNPLKWDTVQVNRGTWRSLGKDKAADQNYYEPVNIGYYYSDAITAQDMKRSLRSATYTPTDAFPEFCEFVMVEFFRDGDYHDSYQIWYLYDYATQDVLCYSDGQWYDVQNYDLLVLDLAVLGESYTYDKYLTELPDATPSKFMFVFPKFFARDTGFDPSYYTGFLNTTPVEDMTEEKAIAFASAEAERLGFFQYHTCLYDPLTGYWCVDFSRDDMAEFVHIYLDQTGCTVQITPYELILY